MVMKCPAEMLVAMVEIAMDGHRSERELRKYSSAVTAVLLRPRTPMIITTVK
jgi:hypothetical protein